MKIRKSSGRFHRFFLRLKCAYRLLFKEKHGVCIYITTQQLTEFIIDGECFDYISMSYFGMMEYQSAQVIKFTAQQIDDTEIICAKAEFEVYVHEQLKNKK